MLISFSAILLFYFTLSCDCKIAFLSSSRVLAPVFHHLSLDRVEGLAGDILPDLTCCSLSLRHPESIHSLESLLDYKQRLGLQTFIGASTVLHADQVTTTILHDDGGVTPSRHYCLLLIWTVSYQVDRLANHGVSFISTTHPIPEVGQAAQRHGLPWLCGATTWTDCLQGLAFGATVLKIYPYSSIGMTALKDLIHRVRTQAPQQSTATKPLIIVAGGIQLQDFPALLALDINALLIGLDMRHYTLSSAREHIMAAQTRFTQSLSTSHDQDRMMMIR